MIGGSRCLATLLVALLVPGTALADPRPISEKDRQVARDMVKRAIARSEAGDHAGAIKIYLQAYSLAPNALLLSNIGAEYQQDGKLEEALQYFCMYLDKDPAGTNAPYATAQARILQARLGRKITGGDVCAPRSPAPSGDTAEPDAGAPAPTSARLRPAAEPAQPPPASPPPQTDGNPTLRYLGIASGVAGMVALGIGAYDGSRAKDISDRLSAYARQLQAKEIAMWPADTQDLQRSGQHYEDLQIRFLIAGGVLVTAGVVMYLVGRPDTPDTPDRGDRRSVAITPTSNGVAMFGRF